MRFSIPEILNITQGILLSGESTSEMLSLSTDSRNLQKGDFFLCLVGGKFDGHDFIEEVVAQGVAGIILQKDRFNSQKNLSPKVSMIGVQDTLRALGDIAQAWRRKFEIPLVAITGSNGKTTTKDMTAAILSEEYRTLATEGNLNNLIGVPKMLLKLEAGDQAAVIEMGMNDFGEIDRLTEMAEPTVGLITNVAYAHLEKLKSLEGVAQAKGELFQKLPKGAVALVNQDDPWISRLPTSAYKITFGMEKPADVFCSRYESHSKGMKWSIRYLGKTHEFASSLFGKANLKNAVAAIAVGFSLGISVEKMQKALKNFKGRSMRMEKILLKKGKVLLNDCYNANPSSTQVALETLKDLKNESPGLAILGEMLEMGDFASEGHRLVGRAVVKNNVEYLITVGPHASEIVEGALKEGMKKENCVAFASQEQMQKTLPDWAEKAKVFLVKGSRGAHMEKITESLLHHFGKMN